MSSSPTPPTQRAETLFQKPYFQLLNEALTEKGVITTQAESFWIHLPIIKDLKKACSQVFPVAEYAWTSIPTYPTGMIGFMVCSKDKDANVKKPLRELPEAKENELYKYYNKKVHEASFVLPNWVAKELQ